MLELYLIRHAQCESNLRDDLIGGRQNESPLTDNGIGQANMLGIRLAASKVIFDSVYSSPAIRTLRTADIALRYVGYPLDKVVVCDDLQELSQGDWEKKPRADVYTPGWDKNMTPDDKWDCKAPNGESQKDVEERVHGWVERTILSQKKEGVIAIFGHGTATKCLLRNVLDSTPFMTYKLQMQNTSITRLAYDSTGWHVVCVNDHGHLPSKDGYCGAQLP